MSSSTRLVIVVITIYQRFRKKNLTQVGLNLGNKVIVKDKLCNRNLALNESKS